VSQVGDWKLGTGYWVLGTGDALVRYDGNTFFVFSQILGFRLTHPTDWVLGTGDDFVGAGSQICSHINQDINKPALIPTDLEIQNSLKNNSNFTEKYNI
jgi:hypothetical protein